MASKRTRIGRGLYERTLASGEKRFDIPLTDARGKLYWETARSKKEALSGLIANEHTLKTTVNQHVLPTLGHLRLKNLAVRHVHQLIDELRGKGLAESTNRLAVDTLARVLAFGKKRGYVAQNVCRELEQGDRPSERSKDKAKPVEPDELQKLLTAAHDAWKLLFYVTAWTGPSARRSAWPPLGRRRL